MNRVAALAWFLLLFVGCSGAANASGKRVDVPIKRTVLTDGTVRFSIPMRIGNAEPIETMLDSGSNGIHILPGAVAPANFTSTEQVFSYGYGSGVKLSGVVAKADIAIAGLATASPIQIHAVQTIGCFENKPHCPASRVSAEAYGIGGDGLPHQGFKAIIGTSMPVRGKAERTFENPLLFLGEGHWIITLPRGGEPGHLVINPGPDELAGYTMFRDLAAIASMGQEALPGCVHNEDIKRAFCGPLLLDSGAGELEITTPEGQPRTWLPGTRGTVEFNKGEGPRMAMALVVSRQTPGAGVSIRSQSGSDGTFMNAGFLPFMSFSVFYDARAHVIGLKRR
jgi:hypothetical protein